MQHENMEKLIVAHFSIMCISFWTQKSSGILFLLSYFEIKYNTPGALHFGGHSEKNKRNKKSKEIDDMIQMA